MTVGRRVIALSPEFSIAVNDGRVELNIRSRPEESQISLSPADAEALGANLAGAAGKAREHVQSRLFDIRRQIAALQDEEAEIFRAEEPVA